MAEQVWMVRAGRDSVFIEEFLSRQMIAIGWAPLGDLSSVHTRDEFKRLVEERWPNDNKFQHAISASQAYRFREEIKPGNPVVTYDSNRRIYHLGKVTGDYEFHPEYHEELRHTRAVQWQAEISRDLLAAETKNCLGAISTIFCLSDSASKEILSLASNRSAAEEDEPFDSAEEVDAEAEIRRNTEQQALLFLQDRLSKLEWDEMQDLVAGLLRAVGYKTRVSPAGPDQGRDIIASPDGFGFQPPRIIVEVKHRKGAMGAQEVRSFVGACGSTIMAFMSAREGFRAKQNTKRIGQIRISR